MGGPAPSLPCRLSPSGLERPGPEPPPSPLEDPLVRSVLGFEPRVPTELALERGGTCRGLRRGACCSGGSGSTHQPSAGSARNPAKGDASLDCVDAASDACKTRAGGQPQSHALAVCSKHISRAKHGLHL